MPILCSYLGTHGYIQQLYSNDGNRDGDVGAQMIIDKDTQHQLEKTLLAMQDVEDNLKRSFQKLAVEGSVHSTFCAEDIQVILEIKILSRLHHVPRMRRGYESFGGNI